MYNSNIFRVWHPRTQHRLEVAVDKSTSDANNKHFNTSEVPKAVVSKERSHEQFLHGVITRHSTDADVELPSVILVDQATSSSGETIVSNSHKITR